MKTKILVTVLMLTTVAAFAQTERREGTSNSNGKSRSQTVEEKKKTTDQTVNSDNKSRNTNSDNQRTVRENSSRTTNSGNSGTVREESRSRETRTTTTTGNNNRTVTQGNDGNRRSVSSDNSNQNVRKNENSNNSYRSEQDNHGRQISTERKENNNGNHYGQEKNNRSDVQQNGDNRGRVTTGEGRNEGLNRNEVENPPRDRSGHTVQSNNNRNANVDSRVVERRYATSDHRRVETNHKVYVNPPRPIEYRREHEVYRRPVYVDIYWTEGFRHDYYTWYPEYRYWNRNIGTRIETISAYDAYDYIGDVARIYGKVYDIDYSYENDEYYLYFGYYFPYQDFSAVVPGWIAREFSHKPRKFFLGRHIAITGLVTIYDDRPEIEVRRPGQIDRYY